jgi:hypothetical protein
MKESQKKEKKLTRYNTEGKNKWKRREIWTKGTAVKKWHCAELAAAENVTVKSRDPYTRTYTDHTFSLFLSDPDSFLCTAESDEKGQFNKMSSKHAALSTKCTNTMAEILIIFTLLEIG